ncbi:serine/threonine protein kinase [Bacillus sp. TS-2]|nr:serine/threonine protein kinase [Bacillus sp. TS-2]
MENLYNISISKISFQLKERHPFDWLANMGEVFSVFDQQDSGNICFGIEKNGTRKFIKYAGARTKNYIGKPEEAIKRLKNSISIYEDLKHEHLINLLEHFEVCNGYVLVFEWFEGENLHPHWEFPPPYKYIHPDSPFYRFRRLSIERRLKAFKGLLDFHTNVAEKDYVAVDFYDGSILYDFNNHITRICDIDLYKKSLWLIQWEECGALQGLCPRKNLN